MTAKISIVDGCGSDRRVKVTDRGQLVVSPIAYDDAKFNELAEPDTAYNFYSPKHNKVFVMTGIVAKADKQVSSTVDATVVVYEADAADATTVDKVLFQMAMVQGDIVSLLPLNILGNEGKFVNAKTTDDDVHMTIMGYYVDA